VVFWLCPFRVAVTVTFWPLLTVPDDAAKTELLCPDVTMALAGTDISPLLLTSDTVAALVAGLFKVMVQVADTWLAIVEGVQDRPVSCAGTVAVAVSVNVLDMPLRVAVSKAVWLETTEATLALNVMLLSPPPMLTLPGTLILALLLSNVTLTGLEVAAVSVTVQLEVPGELTVAGEQLRLVIWLATVRLIVACWLCPFRVAVTIAVWSLVTVAVDAAKVAPLCPGATTTLGGTESIPLLLTSEMVAAVIADLFKVIVQVLDTLLPKLEGAQARELGTGGALAVSVKVWDIPFRVAVSRAVWSVTTTATVALNIPLLSPALILTPPGTVTLALLLDSVTLTVLEVTAVSVMVQTEVPGTYMVPGEQVRLLIWAVAVRLTRACALCPLREAVTVAVWLLLTVPEFAVKVAPLWPDATVTLAGTVSNPLLLASETVTALVAALFKVTVQMLDALLPRVEGAQATDVSWAGATRLNVLVWFTPPALAVTTPVWSVLTCAPVAVKVLLVCPATTVTLEGTVRLALLLESATASPPIGAVPLNETVQELVPGVLIVALAQFKLLKETDTGREIEPEPPLAGM
jgi:hypothetical protein